MRVALGESWMPAPVSSSRSACSRTRTRKPLRASASETVSPPIPAPATITIREGVTGIGIRLDGVAFQGAFRRPRLARRERWIVTIKRRAIRADIFGVIAHIAVHVRVIERRYGALAHEFPGADLDDRNADIVMEMWNDIIRHAGTI